jgi:hypothetical protein
MSRNRFSALGLTLERVLHAEDMTARRVRADLRKELAGEPENVGLWLDGRYARVLSDKTPRIELIHCEEKEIWWLARGREQCLSLLTHITPAYPQEQGPCELEKAFREIMNSWRVSTPSRLPDVVMACCYTRENGTFAWELSVGGEDLNEHLEPVFVTLADTAREANRLCANDHDEWVAIELLVLASSLVATEADMRSAINSCGITQYLNRGEA